MGFCDLKVGVVVPMYGVEKYLPQCLDSVVSQSYENLSVLLVSDGDDKCLDIALDYARKDSRFIVIDKENGGQASARNVGIEFFGGEYDIESADITPHNLSAKDGATSDSVKLIESKPQIECYKILDSKAYIYIYIYICESVAEARFAMNLASRVASQGIKVGVVVPIYNVEKYLVECLDSIISQTYDNLEVLLVNDGSTDKNSFNIAKSYTAKYPNFVLIDKPNLGLSSARNAGIEYFSNEYTLQYDKALSESESAKLREYLWNLDSKANIESTNANKDASPFATQIAQHDDSMESTNKNKDTSTLLSQSLSMTTDFIESTDSTARHDLPLSETLSRHTESSEVSIIESTSTQSKDASPFATQKAQHDDSTESTSTRNKDASLSAQHDDSMESVKTHNKDTSPVAQHDDKPSLQTYKVIGNNPYNIKAIYANIESNTLQIPQIDYIIFLDSDDYWRSDCIELCVKAALQSKLDIAKLDSKKTPQRAEIIWFDWEYFYEGIDESQRAAISYHGLYGFKASATLPTLSLLKQSLQKHIDTFPFAPQGMIDFIFLRQNKLRFINYIYSEDQVFGIELLVQSNYVYVLLEKPYIYRIRPNSSSNFEGKKKLKKESIFPYLQDIYVAFGKDVRRTKGYFIASSWYIIFESVLDFLDKYEKTGTAAAEKVAIARECFLPYIAYMATSVAKYPRDPLHLIPKLYKTKPYLSASKLKWYRKLAVYAPKVYASAVRVLRVLGR